MKTKYITTVVWIGVLIGWIYIVCGGGEYKRAYYDYLRTADPTIKGIDTVTVKKISDKHGIEYGKLREIIGNGGASDTGAVDAGRRR